MNKKGVTLIETLISILLLSILLIGLLGAFYIAKLSASYALHRMTAVNALSSHMEQEIREKFDGGSSDEGDYYATVTSGAPIPVTLDDRGTTDTSDDLIGTITPDPYFPDNIEDSSGNPLSYSGVPYKIIGFIVNWTEDVSGRACSERAVCYVAYHPAS